MPTKPPVEIRVVVTDSQAERLHQKLMSLPFKVGYQEEQHGASLIGSIVCTHAQENSIRNILLELGTSVAPPSDD